MKTRRKIKIKIKQATYPFTSWIMLVLGFFVRKMNRGTVLKTADLLGDLAYGVIRIRRALVEKNLSLVFPEKKSSEIKEIARQVYRNQVLNVMEMLRIPLIKSKEDAQKLVEIKRPVDFFQKTTDQNRGAILVSAHLGSWEMLALCTGLLLAPVHVIVKPLKNNFFDAHLVRWRTAHGNKLIYKDKALREGLKVLRQGGFIGVLGDQSNRRADNYIDFLGRKSTIFLGPAFLALKAGVPVFIETCKRLDNGKYLLEIIEIPTGDLNYNREDIKKLAIRYTRYLEDFILKNPEEWLWLHDRWKRSPA